MGKLYLIGVGVGEAENITVKATNVLKTLDKLYFIETETQESIAFKVAKKYLCDETEIKTCALKMQTAQKQKSEVYNQLAENILADVRKDNNVGFITIGDPMIYSSAIYILKRLSGKIQITVVPAVSSFCATATRSNFPLCFEDKTFTVIPATVGVEKIKNFLQICDTLVILKAYKNFKEIVKLINDSGYENNAIAVSNLGLPTEKVFFDFKSFAETKPQYLTTIIVNKHWTL